MVFSFSWQVSLSLFLPILDRNTRSMISTKNSQVIVLPESRFSVLSLCRFVVLKLRFLSLVFWELLLIIFPHLMNKLCYFFNFFSRSIIHHDDVCFPRFFDDASKQY